MQLDSNALLAFNRLRGSCPSFGNGVVIPSGVCGCGVRLKCAIARNRGREENILFSAA